MATKTNYTNIETLDNELKNLVGSDLFNQCRDLRNNSRFDTFIKQKNGIVEYHFTRTICEKVYNYIFSHRDSLLWNVYAGIDGYKLKFFVC